MELFHRILVPLDGSTKSVRAIPSGIKLGCRITCGDPAASLENPPEPMKQWIEAAIRQETGCCRRLPCWAGSLFKANGIDVRTIVRSKTPEQNILDVVDTDGIDLILMSPHGRGYQDLGHK